MGSSGMASGGNAGYRGPGKSQRPEKSLQKWVQCNKCSKWRKVRGVWCVQTIDVDVVVGTMRHK